MASFTFSTMNYGSGLGKSIGGKARRSSTFRPALALRDHPSMQYRGLFNWPPTWTQAAGTAGTKTTRGEIGVLKQVNGDRRSSKRFYLVIEHEGERYVGALLFDDPVFGWVISKVLRSHIGETIKDIGALDVSFMSNRLSAI